MALAVYNGRYCITKGFGDIDITVTEEYEECKNPGEPSIMTSENACVTSGECTADEINAGIKVNNEENYDFYVISDTGTELTLIMNQNLGTNVAWISGTDYTTANTDGTSCSSTACNDEGPITAVATLKERMSGWTNIEEREYAYSNDGGGNKYTAFTETMRTRMLTYREAITLGCVYNSNGSCPSWLYMNLKNTGSDADSDGNISYGYWTSVFVSSTSNVWFVNYHGSFDYMMGVSTGAFGIRPVITISK